MFNILDNIIKAALSNILITKHQMTLCSMKRVATSAKPTENYYPTLQFSFTLGSVLAPFSYLFWFMAHSHGRQLFSAKSSKNPLYATFKVDNKVILYCKCTYLQWQFMCLHKEWIKSIGCVISLLTIKCLT